MYNKNHSLQEKKDRGISTIPFYRYNHRCYNYSLYLHWHNEFEIIYVEKGSVVYNVETVPIIVSAGECIIINSGQLHSGHCINQELAIIHAILFDLNFLNSSTNDCCQSNYIEPILNGVFRFPLKIENNTIWGNSIISEVKESVETYNQKTFGWEIGVKACLYKIISNIARENKFQFCEKSDSSLNKKVDIVKKSINYIQNHYTEKIYINDLADEVNLNAQYFCRFFKKNTGKTPVEFINQYRVEQAAKLILLEEKSISDICFDVGFDNLSYFIKKFKEYKDCTPSKYKNRVLVTNQSGGH